MHSTDSKLRTLSMALFLSLSVPMFVSPDVETAAVYWCECMGQKVGQDLCGLQMSQKHFHQHPKWSVLTFGKLHLNPVPVLK